MVNKEPTEFRDRLPDVYREQKILEDLCILHGFDNNKDGILRLPEIQKSYFWYQAATDEITEIQDIDAQEKAQNDLALQLATNEITQLKNIEGAMVEIAMDLKENPNSANAEAQKRNFNDLVRISDNPTLKQLADTLPVTELMDHSRAEFVAPLSCPVEKELGIAFNTSGKPNYR